MPSIAEKVSFGDLLSDAPGRWKLFGVAVCLLGIALASLAGFLKEREMPEEEKRKAIKEFNFGKGLLVATFSGVMSACFAFGLAAGSPIGDASVAAGTKEIWSGLPKLIVVLLGGLTTNFIWCVLLNLSNRSGYEYLATEQRATSSLNENDRRIPQFNNYFFSALAGVTWYMQFFFYTMGASKMGKGSEFASWSLHMASIIIFSTIWGYILHEWRGASSRVLFWISAGIATLIVSTLIVGYGAYLDAGLATSH